jgi:antitoxin component YwqK of YwqJK toxin-antitoxin module
MSAAAKEKKLAHTNRPNRHRVAHWVLLLAAIATGACGSQASSSASSDGGCPTGTSFYAHDTPLKDVAGIPHLVHETWCATDDGVDTGPYHRSALSGEPQMDGHFAQSLADGTWRYWDPNGTFVASERTYAKGQPHGTWTTWAGAETVMTVHQWAYGQACGDWLIRTGDKLSISKSYPACESIQPDAQNPPVVGEDMAPKTTDYGWDGQPGKLCTGSVVADNDTNGNGAKCTDAAGKREGPYARWHGFANNAKWVDGFYSNDAASGTWREWFPTGALETRGDYAADVKTGQWRTWYGDGTPATRETWVNGVRDGSAKTWWPGGIAASSGSYVLGNRVGVWSEFAPAGTPLQNATYDENGKLDGPFEQFFDSGEPKEGGTWKHGARTGVWTTWYASGPVASSGTYVDNVQEGKWTFGLSNGDPDSVVSYVHGVSEGESTVWTRVDGALVRTTVQLVHGIAQGPAVAVYDVSGKKAGAWTYVDNVRDGTISLWHENGIQSLDGWFSHGNAHGPWRTWYVDGQHEEEANFLFGELDGVYSDWYPSGQAKTQGTYTKDKKDGPWKTWYADGKPASDGGYVGDIKVGVWKTWTSDGQLTTVTYDAWGNPQP